MNRHMFHLAIPVLNLESSRSFYVDGLGATTGRSSPEWLDVFLWGHQITLHQRPDEVVSRNERGVRHFGVILPWNEWEESVKHLREKGIEFLAEPQIQFEGSPNAQAKLHIEDPSGNLIEVKTYRDIGATL